MANRTIQMSTGIITNWAYNSESYYGFDTGPNLIYGDVEVLILLEKTIKAINCTRVVGVQIIEFT